MFSFRRKNKQHIHAALVFKQMGDSALMIQMGDKISIEINLEVHQLVSHINNLKLPFIFEIVPAYSSLTIHYDPIKISNKGLESLIRDIWISTNSEIKINTDSKTVIIPTLYGGDYGPDLASVSDFLALSENDIVDFHTSSEYFVYALGFSPGFPYLGGLPNQIHCPRLSSPRVDVPSGSVAIAESQTGIYPMNSPGGWRIIGKTPVKMFDPNNSTPAILSPGDKLRFKVLSSERDFLEIKKYVDNGEYESEIVHE